MDDLVRDDPEPVRAFIDFLDGKDPKTITAYRATLRSVVIWLATLPGGAPFRIELVTAAAVGGYLESLKAAGRAAHASQSHERTPTLLSLGAG